jgi:hypothetical protein
MMIHRGKFETDSARLLGIRMSFCFSSIQGNEAYLTAEYSFYYLESEFILSSNQEMFCPRVLMVLTPSTSFTNSPCLNAVPMFQ